MDYYDEIHSDEMHERNIQNPMYIKDMCAKEAKERADYYIKKRENEDFKFIMSRIIDAANHGNYKLTINIEDPVTLTSSIRDRLEQFGYKVEVESIQDNFYRIIISWEGVEQNGI